MVRVQLSDEALKVCDMNLETNHAFHSRNVKTLGSRAHVKTQPCPCDIKELISCRSCSIAIQP